MRARALLELAGMDRGTERRHRDRVVEALESTFDERYKRRIARVAPQEPRRALERTFG